MNEKNASWLLVLASVLWGSSFVASKICMNNGMLPFETVFIRFFWGTLLTWLLFRKQLRRPSKSAISTGVCLGLTTALGFGLEMYGLTMTQASKAAFLTATNLIIFPFLFCLFYKMRPGIYSVVAAGLALLGVRTLSLSSAFGSFTLGDGLLLGAACMYAVNSMILTVLGKDDSRIQISFFQFLTTGVVMGVLTLVQGTGGPYPPVAIAAAVFQILFPTVLCYLIKNMAMQYVNPVRCTLILSTESVFCALLSALLLREVLTLRMLGGVALIAAAVGTEILHPIKTPAALRPTAQGAKLAGETGGE